jgi:hypothetical protein
MRERLGMAMQVVGFVLMPVAVWQGMTERWSFGAELLGAAVGFLLVFVGRGLRQGTRRN